MEMQTILYGLICYFVGLYIGYHMGRGGKNEKHK
jgi:hypothetical protein